MAPRSGVLPPWNTGPVPRLGRRGVEHVPEGKLVRAEAGEAAPPGFRECVGATGAAELFRSRYGRHEQPHRRSRAQRAAEDEDDGGDSGAIGGSCRTRKREFACSRCLDTRHLLLREWRGARKWRIGWVVCQHEEEIPPFAGDGGGGGCVLWLIPGDARRFAFHGEGHGATV